MITISENIGLEEFSLSDMGSFRKSLRKVAKPFKRVRRAVKRVHQKGSAVLTKLTPKPLRKIHEKIFEKSPLLSKFRERTGIGPPVEEEEEVVEEIFEEEEPEEDFEEFPAEDSFDTDPSPSYTPSPTGPFPGSSGGAPPAINYPSSASYPWSDQFEDDKMEVDPSLDPTPEDDLPMAPRVPGPAIAPTFEEGLPLWAWIAIGVGVVGAGAGVYFLLKK